MIIKILGFIIICAILIISFIMELVDNIRGDGDGGDIGCCILSILFAPLMALFLEIIIYFILKCILVILALFAVAFLAIAAFLGSVLAMM